MSDVTLSQLPAVRWLVCRQQGEQFAIVDDTPTSKTEAESRRADWEEADQTGHFRVYAQEMTLREVSRTIRPGEKRWHVVPAVDNQGEPTAQWCVVPIQQTEALPHYTAFTKRETADAFCDLKQRLPEGYYASARCDNSTRTEYKWHFKVECPETDRKWSVTRHPGQVDLLIRDAEADAARAPERARKEAEEKAEEEAAAQARQAEAAWVRRHGPRATEAQQDYILTLRTQLAELGGAATVEGPRDADGVRELTKAKASVYIDVLKKQVTTLELDQAKAQFTVKQPAAETAPGK